jgi:hypothetical protein
VLCVLLHRIVPVVNRTSMSGAEWNPKQGNYGANRDQAGRKDSTQERSTSWTSQTRASGGRFGASTSKRKPTPPSAPKPSRPRTGPAQRQTPASTPSAATEAAATSSTTTDLVEASNEFHRVAAAFDAAADSSLPNALANSTVPRPPSRANSAPDRFVAKAASPAKGGGRSDYAKKPPAPSIPTSFSAVMVPVSGIVDFVNTYATCNECSAALTVSKIRPQAQDVQAYCTGCGKIATVFKVGQLQY